jgi:hypothetical protein
MSVLLHAALGAVIAVALAPGSTGPATCKDAEQRFEAAKRELDLTLQDYAKCVAGSRGRDSCAVEFDTIDAAHERFESAVEEYRTACGSGM